MSLFVTRTRPNVHATNSFLPLRWLLGPFVVRNLVDSQAAIANIFSLFPLEKTRKESHSKNERRENKQA